MEKLAISACWLHHNQISQGSILIPVQTIDTLWATQCLTNLNYFLNSKKELVIKSMKLLWIFSKSNLISPYFLFLAIKRENEYKVMSPSKANSMHIYRLAFLGQLQGGFLYITT